MNTGTPSDLPSADLKRVLLDRVRATEAPSRARVRLQAVLLYILAFVAMATIFALKGGLRQEPRPTALVLETALGAAGIAALAGWGMVARGRSMVGRPVAVLVATGLLTPLALLLWKLMWSAQDPAMTVVWPERIGYRCLLLSSGMAIWPLLALLFVRRGTVPNHPRIVGAALGVAAAACAWVFTDLWCPVAYLPHLLLGHVLPIAILAAVGALLGRGLLGLRDR